MRQGPHSKRGRGRGNRRPNSTPNRNQTFDSNGPDIRIRGNATQVLEKYLNLARDAAAGGDRVLAESYYQHADHYYRIISTFQQQDEQNEERRNRNNQPSGNDQEASFEGWATEVSTDGAAKDGQEPAAIADAPQPDVPSEAAFVREQADWTPVEKASSETADAAPDDGKEDAPAPASGEGDDGDEGLLRTLKLSLGKAADEGDKPAPAPRRPRRRKPAPVSDDGTAAAD